MYRTIRHFAVALSVAVALVQCTADPTSEVKVGEIDKGSMAKIVNSSASAEEGKLLVKFGEVTARSFEEASRAGVATRSDNEALNLILGDIEVLAIERLYPIDVRHEERTRKAGMHRWYIVRFDKERDVKEVAHALSALSEVEQIKYNTLFDFVKSDMVGEPDDTSPTTRLSTPQFNDPMASEQWDLHNDGRLHSEAIAGMDINVHEAWKYTTGDSSIIVAVIDQGVDYTHEDLKDNMWVNKGEIPDNGIDDDQNGYIDDIYGYNFSDDKGEITWKEYYPNLKNDPNHDYGDIGHGTHVAGTIAAVSNNGIGISGIAGGDGSKDSGVKIMSLQIYSGLKKAGLDTVERAFLYAANNGAVLANNSWGSNLSDDGFYMQYYGNWQEAINTFYNTNNHPNLKGCVSLFASGNSSASRSFYPAAYSTNISVTSFGMDGKPAYYTNYGSGCNISAPGGDEGAHGKSGCILSTVSPGIYEHSSAYRFDQGTSMACPHVTGVAALGLAYAKKRGIVLTAEEFKRILLLSVNDIDNFLTELNSENHNKYIGQMGSGRIDAFKVLMNIEGTTCIDIPRSKSNHKIDLTNYLDGASVKIMKATVSNEDKTKVGMVSDPRISGNNLYVTCRNTGTAILELEIMVGTSNEGGTISGYTTTKKFALIVRENFTKNGGWL